MGSVDRCDPTLPLNEMIFYVRRDPALRERWFTDLDGLAREFGLSRGVRGPPRPDVRRLHDLGVHQYYVPQILRLFFGAAADSTRIRRWRRTAAPTRRSRPRAALAAHAGRAPRS